MIRLARKPALLTSSCGDISKRETSNTTLCLHSLSRALLCDLLGNTLSVDSSIDLSPCDLSRVLPLQEERLFLAAVEAEDFAVEADVELTLA